MEKLQPVIRQIFWVCFGFAFLFLLVGWWSASSALSEKIATRKSEVDKAFSDAAQNVSAIPNSRWTDGAKKINEQHTDAFQSSTCDAEFLCTSVGDLCKYNDSVRHPKG